MRKQMKIAAVVSATALLAIGASFTSMAAAKTGTWNLEDDGWYCYDKDGDVYENEFCLYEGKEYYVGDDGLMVTGEWVETEDGLFYIGEDGTKTINTWMDLIPEDGDEDDETERFYFGTKGKITTGKKVIGGQTYYFNEDGEMLSGWVDTAAMDIATANTATADLIHTDENGARMASQWIKTFVPGTAEEDQEDATTYWYYIKSKGGVQTGRNLDINGETYFFGADGKMLYGWVKGTDTDADSKDDTFVATADSDDFLAAGHMYFCGTKDQGYVKKNTWVKTWAPEDYADADDDNDQYWFWVDKNGVAFTATSTATTANAVTFVDGDIAKFTTSNADHKIATKKINNKTYAFKENGQMWSGLVDVAGIGVQYFGESTDGAQKKGAVVIEDANEYEFKFFFGEETKDGYVDGVAVTGQADGKLYDKGLLVTTDNKYEVVELNDVKYLIDADGDIRTSKKKYVNDSDVEILDATVANFKFNPNKGILKGSYPYVAE